MKRLTRTAVPGCVFLLAHSAAMAGLIGGNFQISGAGCRFPDVAYSSVNGKYLVVWTDYNVVRIAGRFVTSAGAPSGSAFYISDASGGLFAAVAYNATNNEFLVTWDDQRASPFPIWGQRVRSSDGALLGSNFQIGTTGGIRSAVAWSSTSNNYLVAYWANDLELRVQRVSNTGGLVGGELNLSADGNVFSGYPGVSYGTNGNQYLVTWDHDDGNIRGRRVDAGTGALLGSTVVITSGNTNDRSSSAYDAANSRWTVANNKNVAGNSYDQWGRMINTSGTLVTGEFPIANTPAFEGDTQFGGDISFAPGVARYFSSFGTDTGWGGQEVDAAGNKVGAQVALGAGAYTSGSNAADTTLNRFLPVIEGFVGNQWYVWGQLYEPAGAQTPFGGTPWAIPGVIQAENFDNGGQGVAYNDLSAGNSGGQYRSTDVDIETTTDTGGGYNVGWMDTGEWLEYTVNVASSTTYDIRLRVASCCSGGSFHVEVNGANVTGAQSFPATGGWQTWTTKIVSGVSLTAGQKVMRVSVDAGGWNLNHVEIVQSAPPPGPATNPNPANGATGVSITSTLSWTAGSGATSHDVRFGTTNPPPFIQNQAGTTYNPGPLVGNTTYFWRIDEKNSAGTTTGTVWSFTTTSCFNDAFAYGNGNLNGNGGWSGSAGSEIQITSQTVRINGGAASRDSSRTISCGASGTGLIQVAVKVQRGTGASTMWSLWLDDPSGVNLCRWYGTGTTARGRIGSTATVTAEQTLTGGWDNLLVKINPTAKTADFNFNGVSIGVLNYSGQGAANTLGRLRFERINNSGAVGHNLSFDDLVAY